MYNKNIVERGNIWDSQNVNGGGYLRNTLNKKGFTLLEVLAVIIILAVIALITVPMVMGTMKSARKSSFKTSMLNLVKAADHYYADHQLDITSPIAFDFIKGGASEAGEELSFKGTKPKTGRVIINVDGEITLQDVSDGKYYANYNSDSDDDVMVTEDNQVLTRDELTDELKKLKKELADTKTELQTAINKKSNQSDVDKISTQLTSTTNLATIANNTANQLNNLLPGKISALENNKLDKTYKEDSLSVRQQPFGKYFNSDPNPYVIIKLGNLKLSRPSMIMLNLRAYQYEKLNSMVIGGYLYTTEGYILAPYVSYVQKTDKYPVSLGVKNDNIYLIIEKGASGYHGFYVDNISVMHNTGVDIVDSGWQIYSASNINDFDKVYKCTER